LEIDTVSQVQVGEVRHTSAGNQFRLERIDGAWRHVRRIANGIGSQLWDADVLYRWHASQWEEQIPLLGEDTSSFPCFSLFIP
jgi:hypothetical protein